VNWPHDFLDFLTALPARDLALLLIAFGAAAWLVLEVRSTARLGPIEIAAIACDAETGKPSPGIATLTSLIRERLAHSGLSPDPAVPAGSPKADLIDAIAASDIPQIGWVAKVLATIPRPRPPSYTLQVTVLALPPTVRPRRWSRDRAPIAAPAVPRLRYSLAGPGVSVFATVRAASEDDAVDQLVADVLAQISLAATGAFPVWARWTSAAAAGDYIAGLDLVKDEDLEHARPRFERAERIERTNTLPRLQLANLDERQASKGVGRQDPLTLAKGLDRYLTIADERPDLVEPRYRGSIVAAILGSAARQGDVAQITHELRDHPELARTRTIDGLCAELESVAKQQARAARWRLRLPYVLLTQWRLRNPYELRGNERRELLRTMHLSAQCRALRRRGGIGNAELRYRRARVWALLNARWWSRGWQAFYNGACFSSLLLEHIAEPSRERHAKRARRYLERAGERAGRQLDRDWMARDDPDLQPIRDRDGDKWIQLVRRLHSPEAANQLRPDAAPGASGAARSAPAGTRTAAAG
jgi:hypothetical protein